MIEPRTAAECLGGHVYVPATDGYCVNCRPAVTGALVIAQPCPACAEKDRRIFELEHLAKGSIKATDEEYTRAEAAESDTADTKNRD